MVERRVATMLAEIDAASAAIEAMPIPDVTLLELAAHLRPDVSLAGARELMRNVRALVARFPETIADMHSGDNLRAQRATVRVLEGSQLILRVTIRGEIALMVDDEPGTTEYHSSLLFLGYLRATDRLLGTMMTLTRGEADRSLPADLTAMAASIDENVLALTEAVRASKAETARSDAAGDADVARIQATMDRVDLLYLEINATYRELSNILRQIAATSQRNPTSLTALGPYFTRIRTLRERIEANTQRRTQLFAELADADSSR